MSWKALLKFNKILEKAYTFCWDTWNEVAIKIMPGLRKSNMWWTNLQQVPFNEDKKNTN